MNWIKYTIIVVSIIAFSILFILIIMKSLSYGKNKTVKEMENFKKEKTSEHEKTFIYVEKNLSEKKEKIINQDVKERSGFWGLLFWWRNKFNNKDVDNESK